MELKIGDEIKLKYNGVKSVFKILGPDDYIDPNCIQKMLYDYGASYDQTLDKFNFEYNWHKDNGKLHELLKGFYACNFRIDEEEKIKDCHEHRIYLRLVK